MQSEQLTETVPSQDAYQAEFHALESGPLYRFRDWPNSIVPNVSIGVYTIWRDKSLVYVGMSGRQFSRTETVESSQPRGRKGLSTRLKSHAGGQRSGNQFCVYVGDRFVLATLSQEQIAGIAAGSVYLDELIRDFIRDELAYRFVVLPTASQAFDLEARVKAGALKAGPPLLNPRIRDTEADNANVQ
jgi:hypothetical protein